MKNKAAYTLRLYVYLVFFSTALIGCSDTPAKISPYGMEAQRLGELKLGALCDLLDTWDTWDWSQIWEELDSRGVPRRYCVDPGVRRVVDFAYALKTHDKNQSLSQLSDSYLCAARQMLAREDKFGSEEKKILDSQMQKRQLSPASCERAISVAAQELCESYRVPESDWTFDEIESAKRMNSDVLTQIGALGLEPYRYCETISMAKLKEEKLREAERLEEEKLREAERLADELEDKRARLAALTRQRQFNIDRLRITTVTYLGNETCSEGADHTILLEGVIGPDSSFAMSQLLEEMRPCKDSGGKTILPVKVKLHSGGGLLDHGYALGHSLRRFRAHTLVENGKVCASSCAVAFLGGLERSLEDNASLLFHAPYFDRKNEYGKIDPDCKVGKDALNELGQYYRDMTTPEEGDRLLDRTLWYCSADDGWVITGNDAARLFGIASSE
ncbi:hypothetical protein NOR51B_1985 [Luminiphilus syltensis NOR5-1B]|uniref:Uncharacterized protein n=1 Tax=Luminiphilus syltensis NOR5-1B TaxID=565045 RepID=B8KWD8_9GAMM|nr:hypothetical protein [Luminiphilus syltensis]EED36037.1 hypothetical protein NOR51B_1985 [Luminiphilus syltensis NOR5-1B]